MNQRNLHCTQSIDHTILFFDYGLTSVHHLLHRVPCQDLEAPFVVQGVFLEMQEPFITKVQLYTKCPFRRYARRVLRLQVSLCNLQPRDRVPQ